MSLFEVKAREIQAIEPHPNADAIELAKIDGFRSIVKKGQFVAGDAVVYIPESALIPERLLEYIGLTGKLSGPGKNRVKPMKLRGVLSQGIVVGLDDLVREGFLPNYNHLLTAIETYHYDLAEDLGIKKYEPELPSHMAGEVANLFEHKVNFDIENGLKEEYLIPDDSHVQITEKLHGTFVGIAYKRNLNHPEMFADGHGLIFSKGLGAKGLMFKNNEINLKTNLYVKTVMTQHPNIFDALKRVSEGTGEDVFMFGEIIGKKVQDLTYGLEIPEIRFFSAFTVDDFLNYHYINPFFNNSGSFKTVPLLYEGYFDKETHVPMLAQGKETVSGKQLHVLEGIVVRDTVTNNRLKFINPDYYTRKGDVTEYQ